MFGGAARVTREASHPRPAPRPEGLEERWREVVPTRRTVSEATDRCPTVVISSKLRPEVNDRNAREKPREARDWAIAVLGTSAVAAMVSPSATVGTRHSGAMLGQHLRVMGTVNRSIDDRAERLCGLGASSHSAR